MAGCDAVIHLAARATFERYDRLRSTIVDGTGALAKAAREAGVRSFVYAGSLLVYGGPPVPGGLIDQESPADPCVDYGRVKREAEDALVELCEATTMRLGIVRLPHVYGARSLLFERLHNGRVPFAGDGTNVYSHLHVADAARVLIEAAGHASSRSPGGSPSPGRQRSVPSRACNPAPR